MAKTMDAAVKEMRKTTKIPGTNCIVYQFPLGHWRACHENSEVGLRLLSTGFIYKDVKAQQFYRFTI